MIEDSIKCQGNDQSLRQVQIEKNQKTCIKESFLLFNVVDISSVIPCLNTKPINLLTIERRELKGSIKARDEHD